jgi:D-alanyl-D-alanine dipeptidase
MKMIHPHDLADMSARADGISLSIDLVYARADHPYNLFGEALYKPGAKLYLHKDFADIVTCAAMEAHRKYGWHFVLYDGLRPVEAQEAMQRTAIVRKNPHWCTGDNRLLSPPGAGAHPRGMAVDIWVLDANGDMVDMGTLPETLSEDPGRNMSHREWKDFGSEERSKNVAENRGRLEACMREAADYYGFPLFALPVEWWDFRFPKGMYEQYAPLSDRELPDPMCPPLPRVAQDGNGPPRLS